MRWLIVAAAVLVATEASADWQYTTWGMSPSEVIAASSGNARPLSAQEQRGAYVSQYPSEAALVSAPYGAAGQWFTATFYFEREHLARVRLTSGSYAEVLFGLLATKYGAPVSRTRQHAIWHDREGGMIVTLDSIVSMIVYEPMSKARNNGL